MPNAVAIEAYLHATGRAESDRALIRQRGPYLYTLADMLAVLDGIPLEAWPPYLLGIIETGEAAAAEAMRKADRAKENKERRRWRAKAGAEADPARWAMEELREWVRNMHAFAPPPLRISRAIERGAETRMLPRKARPPRRRGVKTELSRDLRIYACFRELVGEGLRPMAEYIGSTPEAKAEIKRLRARFLTEGQARLALCASLRYEPDALGKALNKARRFLAPVYEAHGLTVPPRPK